MGTDFGLFLNWVALLGIMGRGGSTGTDSYLFPINTRVVSDIATRYRTGRVSGGVSLRVCAQFDTELWSSRWVGSG